MLLHQATRESLGVDLKDNIVVLDEAHNVIDAILEMQRLQGDGWAFVHAGGTLQERTLAAGELIRVDTGCIVAFQPSVNYEIQYVGKIKSALFGGEGLFFATLRGPGRVWLQSLPLSRLANRIISAVPGVARGGREEGSILRGLGGILDGDNS